MMIRSFLCFTPTEFGYLSHPSFPQIADFVCVYCEEGMKLLCRSIQCFSQSCPVLGHSCQPLFSTLKMGLCGPWSDLDQTLEAAVTPGFCIAIALGFPASLNFIPLAFPDMSFLLCLFASALMGYPLTNRVLS